MARKADTVDPLANPCEHDDRFGVLIVEDDVETARRIAAIACAIGWRVEHAQSLDEARTLIDGHRFNLIVLDRILAEGDEDGVELIEHLLDREANIPVLILSSLATVSDRVRGLERGADIYLTKPFSDDELSAQLRAVARRHGFVANSRGVIQIGGLEVYREARIAKWQGRRIPLADKPFEMLLLFAEHPGDIIGYEMMWNYVWARQNRLPPQIKRIERTLKRLRDALQESCGRQLIHNRRAHGFWLEA